MNKYKGSCLCGSIQIELNGHITDIIHCHCSLCRKATGTAYATNGFINTEDFVILDKDKQLEFYERVSGKRRYFCKNCGSPVFSSNSGNPNKYRIRLGILDSEINERPISHNFVTSKASWDDLDSDLPRYESYEPSRNKS
ncbi:GFA family protein [Parendozoicomonas haliclonae]|uniref:GFA family protein n=1 Tax=Parendozoicomonas haliclonae TaxID=1960125 RepID=UPI000B3623B0|nr:GFA family protein [Parendozoicomonas haliclonae]